MTALRSTSNSIHRPSQKCGRGNPLAHYISDGARATPAFFLGLTLLILSEIFFWASPVTLQRSGLELWFSWSISGLGLHYWFGLPVLTIALLFAWRRSRNETWSAGTSSLAGLVPESIALGLILSMLARVSQLASHGWAGTEMAMSFDMSQLTHCSGLVPAVIAAGVHEEVLFRLGLLGGMIWVARRLGNDRWPVRIILLTLISLLFAVSHYTWLNPVGESIEISGFLCRTGLGIVFGVAFLTRGLALAIGMHCAYNLISLF